MSDIKLVPVAYRLEPPVDGVDIRYSPYSSRWSILNYGQLLVLTSDGGATKEYAWDTPEAAAAAYVAWWEQSKQAKP